MTQHTLSVTATSAVDLTKKQVETILEAVKKTHKSAELQLNQVVDPTVLGGIRLTIGSVEYDGTVAAKLARLKYQLKDNLKTE